MPSQHSSSRFVTEIHPQANRDTIWFAIRWGMFSGAALAIAAAVTFSGPFAGTEQQWISVFGSPWRR